MAYHKTWTNEDLRKWMIENDFYGSTDKAHLGNVLYNGLFFTVSFIEKNDERFIIFSQRAYENCGFNGQNIAGYVERAKAVIEVTKDEGNNLYTALKSTEQKSKKNHIYRNLNKAMSKIAYHYTMENKKLLDEITMNMGKYGK